MRRHLLKGNHRRTLYLSKRYGVGLQEILVTLLQLLKRRWVRTLLTKGGLLSVGLFISTFQEV